MPPGRAAGAMAEHDTSGQGYWKWAGLGFEFAGVVGLFFYFGYRADQRWGCEPWGLLTGGAIGLVGGIYWLAKEGIRMMRELDGAGSAESRKGDGGPERRQ